MESHLDGLARDFLYALRNLRKNRRFSLVAIFTLALGIGTTTVMFSVIYSVIVDALPYKNFERSVVFRIQNLANVGGWKGRDFFLPDETRAFREQNHVFEETIAYNLNPAWRSSVFADLPGKARFSPGMFAAVDDS